MNLLARRRALMAASGGGTILPAEFQQVEWIGANGTQYLIIGQIGDGANTINAQIITQVKWADTTNRQLHGGDTGFFWGVVNGKYQIGQAGTTATNIIASTNSFDEINITWHKQQARIDYIINGKEGQVSRSLTEVLRENFCLFCLKPNSYMASCRLKDVYFVTTEAEHHYYPCYRKTDNVIGMYDIITNSFITNSGSGSFTKGADVN